MKRLIIFIICLFLFFLSSIICRFDLNYYSSLRIPAFAPPRSWFPIIWTTLYILISLSVSKIYKNYNYNDIKSYNKALFFNYLFNQSFSIIFFCFKNLFFSFISCLFNFITSLFLYYETKELDLKASYFLIPYTLFSLFATILSLVIYFLNCNLI